MKKIFFILLIPMMVNAQDIAGTYRLTGIYTLWQQITRGTTYITISDIHDLGLTLPVSTIPPGHVIGWYGFDPMGESIMHALGLELDITFNEDGTGTTIGTYPIVQTYQYDFGCITEPIVLPGTTSFLYQSNLNSGSEIPYNSIVGPLSYQSPFMGETVGNIGIYNSDFFPNLPLNPFNPTLCDGIGNCIDLNISPFGEDIIVGGDPLPGVTGAYVLKGELPSFLQDQGNDNSNLYIEYLTIDGGYSGYGLGEIVGVDEDGDGTDFDRLGSIPYLVVTYLSPAPGCGFNYPIFGDATSLLESEGLGDCIIEVDSGDMGYVMDLDLANWSYFVTFNAVMYASTEDPAYLIDDSDHDYNETDGDGRLIMEFFPTCVLVIDNFHGMWEFKDYVSCDNPGDLNGDILYNVLDIVALVGCILSSNCEDEPNACAADVNVDGGFNVVDVVVLVNCILENNCDDI